MIRTEIEVGDEVRTDAGRMGRVVAILTKLSNPPKRVAVIGPARHGDKIIGKTFEHPIDSLARIHPPHSLDWTDDELGALWASTPAERGKIKAVIFARRVLAGKAST